jgi:hypothetical protein
MITISNSEMSTWQRCRRLWFLRYYLGYVPDTEEVTGHRILGVRIHTAMEGYYAYGLDPLAVLGVLYRIDLENSPGHETELLAERDLASAMTEGYLEWVTAEGKDAGLRVMAAEQELSVPLPGVEGVSLRARLDQAVLDEQTGLLSFLDFKTAANFERHEILALNPQFRFYSVMQRLAAQPDDPRVDGGIIRTLRRVKRSSRSQPPYYAQDEFRYDPVTIESALVKMQQLGWEIRNAREQLDWCYTEGGGDLALVNGVQRSLFPPTPIENDCSWRCPFTLLDPMMDDGSDWAGVLTRSGQYRQEDPYAHYSDDPLHHVRQVLGQ